MVLHFSNGDNTFEPCVPLSPFGPTSNAGNSDAYIWLIHCTYHYYYFIWNLIRANNV